MRNLITISAREVFVGIDVACAARKRLPICIVSASNPLMPLTVPKHLAEGVPRGVGNKEITAAAPFRHAACGVAKAIRRMADEMEWQIKRIAIDAPAAPPAIGSRQSECVLGQLDISVFRTPAVRDWPGIREKCIEHLDEGRPLARLPHANKVWMLFGFELFSSLKCVFDAEIIEVYPFAIVRTLLRNCEHKSSSEGYKKQLGVIAKSTGWKRKELELEARLKETVGGSRHDRLDAFMAAWIASLPPDRRHAYGDATQCNDAIWVPRL